MRPHLSFRCAVFLLCGCVTLAPQPAPAQRWQIDLGGTSARYDSTDFGSASAAPQVEWSSPQAYGVLGGSFAALEGSQWTTQGRGDLSLMAGPSRSPALRASLSLGATGSVHSSGYRTGTGRADGRVQVAGQSAGLWVGMSGSTGWTSSSTALVTSWGPTAGVWGQRDVWNASLVAKPLRFQGSWFPEVNGYLALSMGPVDLAGFGGWRGAPATSGVTSTTWGGGMFTLRLAPPVGLFLSGGSYPSDFVQALPGGRYLSGGIRFSSPRPVARGRAAPPSVPYVARPGGGELRFTLPTATRVDVVGDWTDWRPVPMQRGPGGRWTLRVDLPSGVRRFSLVLNGEQWIVPDGVTAVDDGFGGKTGLLLVP